MNKIIELETTETALLLIHMNLMRDTIKKGMKANYGLLEGRRKLKHYDGIKGKLQEEFNQERQSKHYLELNEAESEMFSSFLDWYYTELKKQTDKEKIRYKENKVLELIGNVKDKAIEELTTA